MNRASQANNRAKKSITNPFALNLEDDFQLNVTEREIHKRSEKSNRFQEIERAAPGAIILNTSTRSEETKKLPRIPNNPAVQSPDCVPEISLLPVQCDENGDPPLLEDLGIDLLRIKAKTFAILAFNDCDEKLLEDADMSGPLIYALIFGSLLILNGKAHFGYIYGFTTIGSLLIYAIMNLLRQDKSYELYTTISVLGYGLLPIVLLSAFAVLIPMKNWFGFLLSLLTIIWATITALRMTEGSSQAKQQKWWLLGYPFFLFYLVFVILAVL